MSSSSSTPKNALIKIAPNLWAYETPFRMWGVDIQNNGVLITSGDCMVAINAPQLTTSLRAEIQALETFTHTQVSYVILTDWHHLFVEDWLIAFPQCKVVFSGVRAQRFHPMLSKTAPTRLIVSRDELALPGVNESDVRLLPWQGFEGINTNGNDELYRGEWNVWLPSNKTLFMFDVVQPSVSSTLGESIRNAFHVKKDPPTPKYRAHFGKGGVIKGFKNVLDVGKVNASVQRVLQAGEEADRVILAHGAFRAGSLVQGKEAVGRIMDVIKETKV